MIYPYEHISSSIANQARGVLRYHECFNCSVAGNYTTEASIYEMVILGAIRVVLKWRCVSCGHISVDEIQISVGTDLMALSLEAFRGILDRLNNYVQKIILDKAELIEL